MRKPMSINPSISEAIRNAAIEPWVQTLKTLRSTLNDDGSVRDAKDAKSILQAVDELLATVREKA